MKLLLKLNCLLLVLVIFVSCVYANENKNSNNNDIEDLMYADSSTDRTDSELNKFYEIEKDKYKDIDDFMGKADGKKSTTEDVNMIETSEKGKKK